MFSQSTRFFSQEGEMSQLSSPLFSDKTSNKNDENDTQGERNEVTVAHRSNEYDALVNSQVDHQSHYTKADTICQQNRQLRGYLEKNLKQIEKRRIKLSNKKREIEEETNIYKEKHKCECQQSVDLQMSLEEASENHQNELNGRQNLKEKLDHIQIVIDYFVQHYSEITKVFNDFEKDKQDLKIELKKLFSDLKEKVDEKNKLKLLSHSEMQEKKQKAQETADSLKNIRETGLNKITVLFNKRSMNLKNQNSLQENINILLNKIKEMNESYIELVHQKKSMKDRFVKLHQQRDELNTTTVLAIQKHKLQIINEQNNNSNLQVKYEENNNFINITSTKEKELINLYNQMNGAVEETIRKQEDKQKKVDEYKDKKSIIFNEMKKLEEEIKELENSEKMNEFLKTEVKKLEESNTANKVVLEEKQNSINKINQEEEQLKKVYDDLVFDIQNYNSELEKSRIQENDLTTMVKEEKLKTQTERDAKLLNNKCLEQSNFEGASKVKELTYDLEEAQNSNNNVKTDKIKISTLIEKYRERKVEADEKLKTIESELEEKCKQFENGTDLKNKTLDEIETLIIDARPYQEELVKLSLRKEALNQDIQQQKENYYKEKEIVERSFNSKIEEIYRETEHYTAIMDGIIKDKVEATEELKQNINKADAERMTNETDLQNLFQQIVQLKQEEQFKRNCVVKLEQRLRAMKKEITITRQEISDAITGNVKKEVKEINLAELKPSSSKRSFQKHYQEPPAKKIGMASNPNDNKKNMNQTGNKQWVEASLSQDEYEFSEM